MSVGRPRKVTTPAYPDLLRAQVAPFNPNLPRAAFPSLSSDEALEENARKEALEASESEGKKGAVTPDLMGLFSQYLRSPALFVIENHADIFQRQRAKQTRSP